MEKLVIDIGNACKLTMRPTDEAYTRQDGTAGTARAGIVISDPAGGYVRLSWLSAALLSSFLDDPDVSAFIKAEAKKEAEAVLSVLD